MGGENVFSLLGFLRTSPFMIRVTYALTIVQNAFNRLFSPRRGREPDSRYKWLPPAGVPINGQGVGEVSSIPFGKFRMSYNGCTVIAAYNALCILGDKVPLYDAAEYFERRGMIFSGALGVHPLAAGRYLKSRGHRVKTIYGRRMYRRNAADVELRGSKAAVLVCWNSTSVRHDDGSLVGAHAVAIARDDEGVTVFNTHDTRPIPAHYDSVASYIKKENMLPIVMFTAEK